MDKDLGITLQGRFDPTDLNAKLNAILNNGRN